MLRVCVCVCGCVGGHVVCARVCVCVQRQASGAKQGSFVIHPPVCDAWDALGIETLHTRLQNVQPILQREVDKVCVCITIALRESKSVLCVVCDEALLIEATMNGLQQFSPPLPVFVRVALSPPLFLSLFSSVCLACFVYQWRQTEENVIWRAKLGVVSEIQGAGNLLMPLDLTHQRLLHFSLLLADNPLA